MEVVKKIVLYLFGLFILLFGNRKGPESGVSTQEPNVDLNKDIEKRFHVHTLLYNTIQDRLTNPAVHFRTERIDVGSVEKTSSPSKKTQTETAKPEDASGTK
ncbi:hypothetical protein [Limibacterium fermenti]|uniref:hypothetical protein n=1 Tax=Limibacterium fermenti TaxID=3229863 RepID=UPI000E9B0F05|nr:hypothetical protein [Porphyromonadaceae bacterium]